MPIVRELVRVDLGNGEYAKVKKKLSKGDRIAIQRAILAGARVGLDGSAPEIDAAAAIEAATFATLDAAVKTLGIRVDEGDVQEMPATPELIRELSEETFDALVEALNSLYPPQRTEEQAANLSGNGARTSRAPALLQEN